MSPGGCSGSGFVTRDGDGLSSLPTTLPALQKWCHFHSHCHMDAPCTFLGVFTVMGSLSWVGSDLSTAP